jgi:dolichol-phosphate mannosyltransferase
MPEPTPVLTIITPTYNEAPNIEPLLESISKALFPLSVTYEVVIVDDNSPDGTADVADVLAERFPVRVVRRTGPRGLSASVLDGFQAAKGTYVTVMDADLSHPASSIPAMIEAIKNNNCDAAVASRYIAGGGCADWVWYRRLLSMLGGLLASGLVSLSDPMTGFMTIRRELVKGLAYDAIGWKIVLDTLAKTRARFVEVPIVFKPRLHGESKLTFKVQLDFIKQLWMLYFERMPSLAQFFKFCLVGLSGVFIDSLILIAGVELFGLIPASAAIIAFLVAVSWNYVGNKNWSFRDLNVTGGLRSFLSFVTVCGIGLGVRLLVMTGLDAVVTGGFRYGYILASLAGISAATLFNFLGSKYFVFRSNDKNPLRVRQVRRKLFTLTDEELLPSDENELMVANF